MRKMGEMVVEKPYRFKVGKVYTIPSFRPQDIRKIHIVSITRDEFEIPNEGKFWDTIVTYRWLSAYKGYWLYEAKSDWSLSMEIRSNKRMVSNFHKRNKTKPSKS